MTRRTNARVAGFMFLFYIAVAYPQMILSSRATSGSDIPARLANITRHEATMRLDVVLSLATFVIAVSLAVALYGLTRDEDHELSVLALCCRVSEGLFGAAPFVTLGLLWIATEAPRSTASDAAAASALAALLFKVGQWQPLAAATCFAAGSTVFAYLFLRARTIPLWLAWVGVLGSVLILVILPLQLAGFVRGPVTQLMWIPIAVFEIVLGFWLLIKGVYEPAHSRSTISPS